MVDMDEHRFMSLQLWLVTVSPWPSPCAPGAEGSWVRPPSSPPWRCSVSDDETDCSCDSQRGTVKAMAESGLRYSAVQARGHYQVGRDGRFMCRSNKYEAEDETRARAHTHTHFARTYPHACTCAHTFTYTKGHKPAREID